MGTITIRIENRPFEDDEVMTEVFRQSAQCGETIILRVIPNGEPLVISFEQNDHRSSIDFTGTTTGQQDITVNLLGFISSGSRNYTLTSCVVNVKTVGGDLVASATFNRYSIGYLCS